MAITKEAVLLFVMCLVTALLSSVEIYVDTSTPQYRTAHRLHPTSEEMAPRLESTFKFSCVDVVAAFVSTAVLSMGHHVKNPLWFLPWLCVCLKGFLLCEVPYLVRLCWVTRTHAEFMPVLFLVTRLFLFVEEVCLWSEILTICRLALAYQYRPPTFPVPLDLLEPKSPITVDQGTTTKDLVCELKLHKKL